MLLFVLVGLYVAVGVLVTYRVCRLETGQRNLRSVWYKVFYPAEAIVGKEMLLWVPDMSIRNLSRYQLFCYLIGSTLTWPLRFAWLAIFALCFAIVEALGLIGFFLWIK